MGKKDKKKEAAAARETHKERGNRFFQAGDYSRAYEEFTEAIASGEGKSDKPGQDTTHMIYSNRSATFIQLKLFSNALSDAEECVHLSPQWSKGYFRRGEALKHLLKYSQALENYEKALEYDEKDVKTQQSLEEMKGLLKEISDHQSKVSSTGGPSMENERFHRLIQWLLSGGSQFPKLYLQYYSEEYRGVHALIPIPSEEMILYIPHSHIMTSEVAKATGIAKKIVDLGIELRSKHSYLASYLLEERAKGENSYWFPYLSVLPKDFLTMPMFFSKELLNHLKGSFTLQRIHDRIESLKAEYENICRHIPEMTAFSHQDFIWARLVVITRIFGMVIKGHKTDGLVPLADMLNHRKPKDDSGNSSSAASSTAHYADTRWNYTDDLDGFVIHSVRPIPRGDQIYDSYGRKCNSRFFVNYGFSLDHNEDDNEAVFQYSYSSKDPLYSMKLRLTGGRIPLNQREFQVPAYYKATADGEKKTQEMFSYLRFLYSENSELLLLGNSSSSSSEGPEILKIDEIEPISIENEIRVLKAIDIAARQALAAFPDSLEEDNRLLSAENSFTSSSTTEDINMRNIILQRRGEKQIFHWYIELSRRCIELLRKPWREVKKETMKCYITQDHIDYYIVRVLVPLVKKEIIL